MMACGRGQSNSRDAITCSGFHLFSYLLLLQTDTAYLDLVQAFPRALWMCCHVVCPVLRAPATSSVDYPRCLHHSGPLPQLSEDLALSGSTQPNWTRSVKRALASLPFFAATRRPATAHRRERQREMSSREGDACANGFELTTIAHAHRDEAITQWQAARTSTSPFPIYSSRLAGPSALTTAAALWQHAASAAPILRIQR